MNLLINWPKKEKNPSVGSEAAYGHLGKSRQVGHPEQDEQKTQGILEVHNWIKTCEGFSPRSFCQKNKGTIRIK
jgi:hypothetical protein